MSLAIDVEKIATVLLADGWHLIDEKSFTLDSYEFLEFPDDPNGERFLLHGGGQSGVCATGYSFIENALRVSGPLTAVLAVGEHHSRS
jgi:hypothetical protein